MSLTLLHGPAGSGKTERIIRQIIDQHFIKEDSRFCVVLPDEATAGWFAKKLTDSAPPPRALATSPILSLDRFFLKLLKANQPRVHRAPLSLSRNIIRALLEKKPALKARFAYAGAAPALARTFIQLKESGIGSGLEASRLFAGQASPEIRDILKLFDGYQKKLSELHYVDRGDLLLIPLRKLKEKRLIWPAEWGSVYWDRLFPVSLGLREFLMHASHACEMTVSYSFDYRDGEDPFFYPAYGFLGEIASKTDHVERGNEAGAPRTFSFSDPESECLFIASDVRRKLAQGIPPEGIAIVCRPGSYYHRRLTELLDGIALADPFTPPLETFMQSNQSPVPFFLRSQSPHARNALIAAHDMEEFEENWNFEMGILGISENSSWKKEELNFWSGRLPAKPHGIRMGDEESLNSFEGWAVTIAGYTAAGYPRLAWEYPLWDRDVYLSPLLKEILKGLAYRMSLQKASLRQIIARTNREVTVTHPLVDWNGRDETPARLIEGLGPFIPKNIPFAGPKGAGSPCFPRMKSAHFNVTELETYLQCPYQYYARHFLKLGKLPDKGPDIPPDIRGLFTHRILEKFYADYTEDKPFLFEEGFIPQVQNTVGRLVEEERKSTGLFAGIAFHLVDHFCQRVAATCAKLIGEEIRWVQEGTKKTKPAFVEWAFGRGRTPPLALKAGGVHVFISGRVDRIDVNGEQKTFSVIDYKTGSFPSSKKVREGASLQIPLYLMAAKAHLLCDHRPASGMFVSLKDIRDRSGLSFKDAGEEELLPRTGRIAREEFAELEESITLKIGEITQRISDGDFAPQPKDPAQCRYCDFRRICHYRTAC